MATLRTKHRRNKRMERRILRPIAVVAAVAAAVAAVVVPVAMKPAAAQLLPDDPAAGRTSPYATCMQLARSQPRKGLKNALAWRSRGGGDGARHCAAIAKLGLGEHETAAKEIETLAWSLPDETPNAVRAQLLAQAGQIWLEARRPREADALLSAAVDLAPRDPEIRVDRAMALAAAGRYQDAIVDLSAAIVLDDRSADALVLRASAYRQTDRIPAALADVERALGLEPGHAEALLERGLLRRLTGDEAGATTDWLEIVRLHPGRPAAIVARRYLEQPDQIPQQR